MKRTAWGHTKIKRLMRALAIPQYGAIGILESLWNLTSREAPAGNIGKLSNEDIALQIDWQGNPDELIQGLLAAGWLDIDEELRLFVHDWHEHADDAVDNALARAGQRYANGRAPRMKRLSSREKELLNSTFYEQETTKSHSVRTEAHEKPQKATALPSLAKPSQALPSLAKPEPQKKAAAQEHIEPPADDAVGFDASDLVAKVVCAHPKSRLRSLRPSEVSQAQAVAVLDAMAAEVAAGATAADALAMMLERTQLLADKVPRSEWRFFKDPAQFFRNRDYRLEPEDFTGGANASANRNQQRTNSNLAALAAAQASRRDREAVDRTGGVAPSLDQRGDAEDLLAPVGEIPVARPPSRDLAFGSPASGGGRDGIP